MSKKKLGAAFLAAGLATLSYGNTPAQAGILDGEPFEIITGFNGSYSIIYDQYTGVAPATFSFLNVNYNFSGDTLLFGINAVSATGYYQKFTFPTLDIISVSVSQQGKNVYFINNGAYFPDDRISFSGHSITIDMAGSWVFVGDDKSIYYGDRPEILTISATRSAGSTSSTPVPEPGSLTLMLGSLGLFGLIRARRG
jgi:hypothetical protein